jgi:hypothetical protein
MPPPPQALDSRATPRGRDALACSLAIGHRVTHRVYRWNLSVAYHECVCSPIQVGAPVHYGRAEFVRQQGASSSTPPTRRTRSDSCAGRGSCRLPYSQSAEEVLHDRQRPEYFGG